MNIVLRTTLPPANLRTSLEAALRQTDPSVPMVRLRDMNGVFEESIRRPRLLAQLLGGFAGLALLLAAIGTYGVLSYMMAERRREIGIRMALGAAAGNVMGQVMKHGLMLMSIGIVVGVAGGFALNRLIASLLFGVAPTDPMTMSRGGRDDYAGGGVCVLVTLHIDKFVGVLRSCSTKSAALLSVSGPRRS